jgi:rRNA maturation RNase YbeY
LAEKEVLQALVTGGAGFIGSQLVELLIQRGHHVLVWDNFSTGRPQNLAHLQPNERLAIEETDIARGQPLEVPADIDWVFHLAALADIVPSIQEPEKYFRANVLGTFNLLQALRERHIKKLVYAASSSCYGIPDTYPTPETAPNHPQYPYALTKQLAEDLVLHWGQVYGLPFISLRLFNVYGPRSRTSGTYGAVFGPSSISVDVTFVDEDVMTDLHVRCRGLPGFTDFFSYSTTDVTDGPVDPHGLQDEPTLGDIVICPDFIASNTHSEPTQMNIDACVIHAMLHLVGYGHKNKVMRSRMLDQEQELEQAWHLLRDHQS